MKIIQSKGLFAMIGEEEKPYVFIDNSEEYRKALEEIREITINTCNYNENCDGYACYSCQYIDEPSAIKKIQIKINEVLK